MCLHAGAHDRVLAHAELGQVQPAAGAGAGLRGLQGLLPGLALGAQTLLADQHGQCRCACCARFARLSFWLQLFALQMPLHSLFTLLIACMLFPTPKPSLGRMNAHQQQ